MLKLELIKIRKVLFNMKQIKFIEIKSELDGWGGFKGSKYIFPDINETIEKMLKEGWSYLGYVPNETRGTGDIEKLSLIFQKEDNK